MKQTVIYKNRKRNEKKITPNERRADIVNRAKLAFKAAQQKSGFMKDVYQLEFIDVHLDFNNATKHKNDFAVFQLNYLDVSAIDMGDVDSFVDRLIDVCGRHYESKFAKEVW